MLRPSAFLIIIMAAMLAACGGSSPVVSPAPPSESASSGDEIVDFEADSNIPQRLQVGSGVGVSFALGKIRVVSVESSTDIDAIITVTDKNNGNELANGNYRAEFVTQCLVPNNGNEVIIRNGNTLTKRFSLASDCSDDSISVTVYPFGSTRPIGSASGVFSTLSPTLDSVRPALGSGSVAAFREGQLLVSDFSVLAGSSLNITVTGVDKNKGNELLAGDYSYKFSSNCVAAGKAAFSSEISMLRSGLAQTGYININCEETDTIIVRLFSKNDDVNDSQKAIASAQVRIKTALPKLGFGSGFDFNNGVIAGESVVEGKNYIELSALAIDVLNNNKIVSGGNYEAAWSSNCSSGQFSLPRQSLSDSNIKTRYFIENPRACLGDKTITLQLSERNNPDIVLVKATKDISVSLGVNARLGTGTPLVKDNIRVSPTTLAAGGTALIEAKIIDANNDDALILNRAFGVTIDSECAALGQAEFISNERVVYNGDVRFTYIAKGCEGLDRLTVTLYPSKDGVIDKTRILTSVTDSISVQKAQIGGLLFSDLSAPQLSVYGIGTKLLPTQGSVTFRVVDKNADPVSNQEVKFSLTSTVGGINLTSDTAITDEAGYVKAVVNSGTTQTVTSVIAKTVTPAKQVLETSSLPISITTGYPDQDSFSLSVDVFNPAGYNVDGTVVKVSVLAADYFQNPVPDGTSIIFTTESGNITETCRTVSGRCSVDWTSSGVRPGHQDPLKQLINEEDAFTGETIFGMTTILAYTEGDAGFTDTNGNGVFDQGEPFVHLGEAFRDDNWSHRNNWRFSAGARPDKIAGQKVEVFYDINNNGRYDEAKDPLLATTFYQGSSCSESAKALGHCAERVHVRAQARIVQSATKGGYIVRFFVEDESSESGFIELKGDDYTYSRQIHVLLQDINGNIPPHGTLVKFEAPGYDVTGDRGAVANDLGFINEFGVLPGFPVTRGQLYKVVLVPKKGEIGDNLSVDVTYSGDAGARSDLKVRWPPKIELLYKAGDNFEEYTGQALSSGSKIWVVVSDPMGFALPQEVGFAASIQGDVALSSVASEPMTMGEITYRESTFPKDKFNTRSRIYLLEVKGTAGARGVLNTSALYPGGRTTEAVSVFIP